MVGLAFLGLGGVTSGLCKSQVTGDVEYPRACVGLAVLWRPTPPPALAWAGPLRGLLRTVRHSSSSEVCENS